MSERAWAGIAFGATLGIVIGLRLNAQGMLLIATVLMAALLLCPLVAWRVVTANLWPEEELWVRIERVPAAPPRPAPPPAPALPVRSSLPARRGAALRSHRAADSRRFTRHVAPMDAAKQ